ncbi:MAG: DUF4149 domain-containing protein [Pontibacterium sp.]
MASLTALLITLHILSAALWVGGMFFAYVCLRPVAAQLLEPPQRLPLWSQTFNRFFRWVWVCIALLILSGHWMIALLGGMAAVGLHVHLMLATGYLMIALFGHLFFVPYKRLKNAVAEEQWPVAAKQLNNIRIIVGTNLILGLITIIIGAGGRYL